MWESYEKLELICDKDDYTLINIINVVDCLELQKMKYRVYKGNKERIQKNRELCF